jgi:hypothetical protein
VLPAQVGGAETPMNQIEGQSLAGCNSGATSGPSAAQSGQAEASPEESGNRSFHFVTGTRTCRDGIPIAKPNLLAERTVLEGAIILF